MRTKTGVSGWVRTGLVALAVILGGGAFPSAAKAQWGIWGMLEQLKKPSLSGRALKEYGDLLGLTSDQRGAADELLFTFEREHRDFTKRYNEIASSIGEEYDQEEDQEVQVWRDVWPKINKSFIKKAMKLDKGIMDDLKTLLDQTQLARWPQVERVHRRRTTLGWGGDSMNGLDLAEIVRGLRLDEAGASAVLATLEQYEADLDRELIARNKYIEDTVEPWFALMAEYDQEKWTKMFKEFNDTNKKVGEVNVRYRPQIQAQLSDEMGKEFDLRVKQALYPKVYRKSHATMTLDAADKIEGLEAATQEGVRGARESYERDAATLNEKWASVLAEEDSKNDDGGQNMWWGNWRQESEKLRDARKARRELDKRTVAAVHAMLTEEQRKKLPDRKWRPEWDLDAPSPVK